MNNKDPKFRAFLISHLRRASRYWKPLNDVLAEARVERGVYICKLCKKFTKSKEIHRDHIDPIIPVTGFDSWDAVTERLFFGKCQAICKTCHKAKTKEENAERRRLAKEKKNGTISHDEDDS